MGIARDQYTKLSKTISHALRHEPWIYELELDDEGWVSIPQLLNSLWVAGEVWRDLDEADIDQMIRASSKQRYEIQEGRIRAIYGHSLPGRLSRVAAVPPEVLFHGTSPQTVSLIESNGLKPMQRQNVHLSVDEATAIEVGKRKSKTPKLLRIDAKAAHAAGIPFFMGNDKVWLANEVPPQFIEF